jgi:hypothetical protein
LFYAVAQVIAYVYGLNAMTKDAAKAPRPRPKVPKAFKFDEYGRTATRSTSGSQGDHYDSKSK